MTTFQTIAILLTLAALAGYMNHRLFKLPTTIGLMAFALILSLLGIGFGHLGLIDLNAAGAFLNTIDFSSLLLHGMLSLLLFAGALHIDLDEFTHVRNAVAVLASAGVVISAVVTGALMWLGAQVLHFPLPLSYALLFGALIAPTDPIAVLAILKTTGVSKRFYARIGGESLFNDGVSVVLFLTILGVITSKQEIHLVDILMRLVWQVLGGAALGGTLGWFTHRMLRSINEYKVEVLLTLALATGGYALAEGLEFSAPIAMAAAGLVIGHHRRINVMSGVTRKHLDLFWELLDEILNAVLFLLIGLELMIIPVTTGLFVMSTLAIGASLAGRFVSVGLPISLLRIFVRPIAPGTIRLLTWGGLRGGISIAMALSLPAGTEKDLLLAITYIVVVFSILAQGLTFRSAVHRIIGTNHAS
jgi:CPA1 family monovalent cation:H+ antiporter